MSQYCYTSPDNLRSILDGLETAAPYIAQAAALVGAGVAAGPAGVAAVSAVATAGKKATDQLLNAGDTGGFKQHILRSEDEGKLVTLKMTRSGDAVISSESGTSYTTFTCKAI